MRCLLLFSIDGFYLEMNVQVDDASATIPIIRMTITGAGLTGDTSFSLLGDVRRSFHLLSLNDSTESERRWALLPERGDSQASSGFVLIIKTVQRGTSILQQFIIRDRL